MQCYLGWINGLVDYSGSLNYECRLDAGGMTQWVVGSGACCQTWKLVFNPGTHMVESENQILHPESYPPTFKQVLCTPTHMHTYSK